MAIDREKLIYRIKTLDGLIMHERNDLIAYLRGKKEETDNKRLESPGDFFDTAEEGGDA